MQPPHTIVDNCEWFPRCAQAPDSSWLRLRLGEDAPAAGPPADVLSTSLDRASEAIIHCVSSISALLDTSLPIPRASSTVGAGRALGYVVLHLHLLSPQLVRMKTSLISLAHSAVVLSSKKKTKTTAIFEAERRKRLHSKALNARLVQPDKFCQKLVRSSTM
eukprot:g70491.t1